MVPIPRIILLKVWIKLAAGSSHFMPLPVCCMIVLLSKMQSLIVEVTAAYEDYEPTKAARAIQEFVNDHLSNWYVRLNRKRFWQPLSSAASKDDLSTSLSENKKAAYETLFGCLAVTAQWVPSIVPSQPDIQTMFRTRPFYFQKGMLISHPLKLRKTAVAKNACG